MGLMFEVSNAYVGLFLMFAELNTERFDMIANEVGITPERKKNMCSKIPISNHLQYS